MPTRSFVVLALLLGASSAVSQPATSQPDVMEVPLWPAGKMPGAPATQPEHLEPARPDKVDRLTDVSVPTLAIYPAPASSSPRPAVIICPGGGYKILSMNSEGSELALWLNKLGITGIVLKYRVPGNRDGAFDDIQRAVRLVRQHAKDWHIDEHHLGVMGFSAGGHLCARLSTNYSTAAYPAIDDADQLDCKPDFVVLVYPAYLNTKDGHVAPELPVTSAVPPTLIVHSEDDKTFVPGSKIYDAALTANHVPHKFELFITGGHGYGLRCTKEARVWPERCADWMRSIGVLPATTQP